MTPLRRFDPLHPIRRFMATEIPFDDSAHADDRGFRALVDNVANVIIVIEPDNRIRYINAAVERLLGYTADELIGVSAEALIHPDDIPASRATIDRLLRDPQAAATVEQRLRHRDGGYRIIETTIRNLIDDPAVGGLVASAQDVTDERAAQRRAREEKTYVQSIITQAPVILATLDREGRILMQEGQALRKIGRRPNENVGQSVFQLHPDRPEMVAAIRRALAGEANVTNVEFRGQGFELHLTPSRDAAGDVNGVISVAVDVTEHRRAERALQQQEHAERQFRRRLTALHRVRNALSSIDDLDALWREAVRLGAAELGFDRMSVWRRTDRAETFVGTYGIDEGGNLRSERTHTVAARPGSVVGLALAEPGRAHLRTDTPLFNAHAQQVGRGWQATAALWNGEHILGVLSVDNLLSRRPATDADLELVTLYASTLGHLALQLRTQQALRASEERYRGLVESQQDLIVRVTLDRRFTFVNDAYCRKFGKSPKQLLGRPFMPLVHEADRAAAAEAMTSLQSPPHRVSIEQRAMTVDGWRWIAWEDCAIFDAAGDIVEVQAVGRDVTERHEAARALREHQRQLQTLARELAWAEERERRRIATLLHDEIGQLLATIRLRLQMVARHADASVTDQLTHALDMVQQAIELTRHLTFQLSPPELFEIGLAAALEQTAERFARDHGLAVCVHANDDHEPLDEELRVTLYRATRELLFNVVKHAEASRAEVEIASNRQRAEVIVSDDGVGMPNEATADGGGFGLFNVRQRVEQFAGSVEIEHPPGGGARVRLSVPIGPQ